MKYIITGATSFIGMELCHYLVNNGDSVIAVCRPDSEKACALLDICSIEYAEMADYSSLCTRISNADVFINLAWGGTGHSGRNEVEIHRENVKYSIEALCAAEKMGCKVFVEAGSQAEYGSTLLSQNEETECNPFSEYGKAKLTMMREAFKITESLNIKYIHLRIFSIFGEEDHPWTLIMSTVKKCLNNDNIDLSPCTQNWNFLYVKDAVKQIERLCSFASSSNQFKHEIFNLASNDTRVLSEFVERIKFLTKSYSVLNYGAFTPNNLVSLQPNIEKLHGVIGDINYTPFDSVIYNIVCKIRE